MTGSGIAASILAKKGGRLADDMPIGAPPPTLTLMRIVAAMAELSMRILPKGQQFLVVKLGNLVHLAAAGTAA